MQSLPAHTRILAIMFKKHNKMWSGGCNCAVMKPTMLMHTAFRIQPLEYFQMIKQLRCQCPCAADADGHLCWTQAEVLTFIARVNPSVKFTPVQLTAIVDEASAPLHLPCTPHLPASCWHCPCTCGLP